MIAKEQTCCFTGHRPVKLPWGSRETDPRCIALKDQIAATLDGIYETGYRRFICGMAIGCDLYFAEAVLALKQQHPDILLEAAIPCDDQAEKWNRSQREHYAELLEQCDLITHVSHVYSPGCMMKRNQYMVDNAELLIACYDGKTGGTFNTLRYALEKDVKILHLPVE